MPARILSPKPKPKESNTFAKRMWRTPDAYPVDSIKDIHESLLPFPIGPWGDVHAEVAGMELSLDDIEHLARYAEPGLAARLEVFSGEIEYEYDWDLNQAEQ